MQVHRSRVVRSIAMVSLLALHLAMLPGTAEAHDLVGWCGGPLHWNKRLYNPNDFFGVANYCTVDPLSNSACSFAIAYWYWNTGIQLAEGFYVQHVRMYDADYGQTPWLGLASICSNVSCHILPDGGAPCGTYTLLNNFYSLSWEQRLGVMCQELGHILGLDHADSGDCMALGYYPNATNYPGSHSSNDLFWKYYYYSPH